ASSTTIESVAWQAMLQWSFRQHRGNDHALASRCDRYDAASLYGCCLSLLGPAGESNELHFIARGSVCCIADNTATLLNQLAATFASGNQAVIDAAVATLLPSDLPEAVRTAIRIVPHYQDCEDASLLLVDTACLHRLPTYLAEDGFIAPVLLTTAKEDIPMWRLSGERTVCTNTAAAGGNAALMTLTP